MDLFHAGIKRKGTYLVNGTLEWCSFFGNDYGSFLQSNISDVIYFDSLFNIIITVAFVDTSDFININYLVYTQ